MNTTDPLIEPETITQEQKAKRFDRITGLGYLLLAISITLYVIEEYATIEQLRENFAVFIMHYIVAMVYVTMLIVEGSLGIRKSWRKENIHKTIILLNLFLTSAYALNRELPVFEDSTPWFCVYLILCSAAILSYRYFEILPSSIHKLQLFLLGSALVLYSYLTLYVAEVYAVGAIGTIFFGIGAHILVPIFLVIGTGALIKHYAVKSFSAAWIIAGSVATIATVAVFVTVWNGRIKRIEKMANQSVLYADTELPVWVKVAQSVKCDWITERILKSDLVYTVVNDHLHWDFIPSRAHWDEERKHDPLVFIASLSRKSSLSKDDRIKILLAITDSRHKTQERLWSGDNLSTAYIVTDADIYPDLRLAYTEKYFNIRNNKNTNRTWGTTEEAIYTFQLPEGSVVTSLSLWINGKEEKGILTSKQKANKAYKTIVGVESRDPSVVHWQEGNTVSVRIFPCTPQEERKFKIGITSPLPEAHGRVHYKAITFRGPHAHDAVETFRIRFLGTSAQLQLPETFEKNAKGEYVSEQEYDPDFSLSFEATPVKTTQFSFDGFTYSLSAYKPEMKAIKFTNLYLDINSSWSEDEIGKLKALLSNYSLYAFADGEFIQLSNENWDELTDALHQRSFSIFPFHRIKDLETSLVISKGRELSPYLADFKESNFATGISSFFASKKKVYLYNLSSATSTYIRSLKELRGLAFAKGEVDELVALLTKQKFPASMENKERIVLYDADVIIEKKAVADNAPINSAPDHLARLFAYNNIMRAVGSQFFKDDFINEALVDEAATAYVVSPVSSLIVLETKEDYERFGIKDKDNSLHNASKQSSGAVPEPHEWAMIILFGLLVVYCIYKQRNGRIIFSK